MNNLKLKLNRYVAPLILLLFLIIVVFVFIENINYFKLSLANAFKGPEKINVVEINKDLLKKVVVSTNIDIDKIQLLKNK